jgi:hypothetical protein
MPPVMDAIAALDDGSVSGGVTVSRREPRARSLPRIARTGAQVT